MTEAVIIRPNGQSDSTIQGEQGLTMGAVHAIQHEVAEPRQACKLASAQPRPPPALPARYQNPQRQPFLQWVSS